MKKFLIVVDMQKDFVSGSLGSSDARSIVDNVINKICEFDAEIIITMDTHFENYLNTAEGKKLPVEHCIKGTEGWQIIDEVKNALNSKKYTAIEKKTFGSIDIINIIKDIAQDDDFSIELIGLCTDICVVSNAIILKAAFCEKEISVDASCCAGTTLDNHNMALNTMACCQINIINK